MSQTPNIKIKRHKRVYQGAMLRRVGVFKMIGGILLLCALFFVGYSVAEPVMSFVNGEMRIRLNDEKNASSSPPQSSSSPSSDETKEPGGIIGIDSIKAVYMPTATFADDSRFEAFTAQAKGLGVNTVVMEVKDASGVIYYDSKLTQANEIGAVMEDSPNLSDRIEQLKAQGIQSIVRLHTFKDPLAARKIKGAAARYTKDVTAIWLDNYATEGGKPWVNPESAEGLSYITTLVTELAQSGAAYIMLDSLHYPTGVGLNLAYFGPKSNDSRLSVLNSCVAHLESAVKDFDCKLIVAYEAQAYLSKSEMIYGGDPADIAADIIAPIVLPSAFSGEVTIGKTRVTDPETQAYNLTKAFGEYLLADIAAGTKVLPIVSTDLTQTTAFRELRVTPYVLYAADGKYE